jgi:hypothetical protein
VNVDTGSVSRRDGEGKAHRKDTEGLCAAGFARAARAVAAVLPGTTPR